MCCTVKPGKRHWRDVTAYYLAWILYSTFAVMTVVALWQSHIRSLPQLQVLIRLWWAQRRFHYENWRMTLFRSGLMWLCGLLLTIWTHKQPLTKNERIWASAFGLAGAAMVIISLWETFHRRMW
jgi:hypothetical protein